MVLGKIVNCVDNQQCIAAQYCFMRYNRKLRMCVVKVCTQINDIREELYGWQLQYPMRAYARNDLQLV